MKKSKVGVDVLKLILISGVLAISCLSIIGCGGSTSTFPLDASAIEAASSTETASGLATSSIIEKYAFACGRTNQLQKDYLSEGNVGYGCVVLDANTETKYLQTVGDFRAKLISESSTVYAKAILAETESKWHILFQMPEESYNEITSIEATATVEGSFLPKTIEDPHDYNPESL